MNSTELLKSAKTYMIVEGLLSIGLGLIIMFWPGLTTAAIIIYIGVYGIVMGLVLFFKGLLAHKGEQDRATSVVVGILSLLFGLLVLNVPVAFAAFGVYFIAAMIAVRGIYDMVSSFTTEDTRGHRVLLFIAGAFSLLFSLWVFNNPGAGALLMVFLLGLMLMISGGAILIVGASLKTK